MNKDLLVEIFAPTTGRSGWGMIGTGYPVAKDRILTARHVLFPPDRDYKKPIVVRWHYQPVKTRKWIKIPAEDVLWPGNENCDAAVIACPFPKEAGPWGTLSLESPRPGEWESEGFPAVGKRNDNSRVATAMRGGVHRAAKAATFFALDLNVGPEHRELLRGASGSPVMHDWKLLGVIVQCPPHFDSQRLWAMPSCRLLEVPEFCKAIGYTPQTAVLELLKEQVVLALSASEEAMEVLETTLPIPGDDLADRQPEVWARRLVETMLGRLELKPLIRALREAHRKLCMRQKTAAANAIAHAANAILPAVYDRAIVRTFQSRMFDAAMALVDLPAATHTVAEIIMAGAEGRQACFLKAEEGKRGPVAAYSFSKEQPTTGIDSYYDRWIENIERALAEKFVDPDYDQFLEPEQRREMIANRLALEAEEQRTRYVVFQFKYDDERKKATNALMRLRERYPALVLLDLSTEGSQIVEESDLIQPFIEMLKTELGIDP